MVVFNFLTNFKFSFNVFVYVCLNFKDFINA